MFYVYELLDPSGAVFYVGKGSGRRMYQHTYKARLGEDTPRAERIRAIIASGGEVTARAVFHSEDESAAYAEEVRLIAWHGRKNITNGTRGGCGIRDLSAQSRQKIAKSRLGKKASPETIERSRLSHLGQVRTEETRRKISATNTGKPCPWATGKRSDDYKAKMSLACSGRIKPPEECKRISLGKMGHAVSQETRLKISETKKKKGLTAWNKGLKRKNTAV